MIPDAFQPAQWRGTTNTDGENIGLSFDLPDGATVRLSISVADAWQVADSLREYCCEYGYWVWMN